MVLYSIGMWSDVRTCDGRRVEQNHHSVVPDFLVQTGDRTGTGGGGESFFGGAYDSRVGQAIRPTMSTQNHSRMRSTLGYVSCTEV